MNYYTKNNRNKVQTATAIGYNQEEDAAPRILATGKGSMAEKILEIAGQERIPIHQDEDIAEILAFLETGSLIPVEAYGAIAKILSHIYKYKEENV